MRNDFDEEAEETSPPVPAPWACALLELTPYSNEAKRRQAILGLLRDQGFAPGGAETQAICQAEATHPPALHWQEPKAAALVALDREFAHLRANFDAKSSPELKAELTRIKELAKPYPFLKRAADQLVLAHKLRRVEVASLEGEKLRDQAAGWLLKTPNQFAAERFEWFDAQPEQNAFALANLKNDDPEIFGGVPGLDHYLNPKDPEVREGELPEGRRRQIREARGEEKAAKPEEAPGGGGPLKSLGCGGLFLIVIGLRVLSALFANGDRSPIPNPNPPFMFKAPNNFDAPKSSFNMPRRLPEESDSEFTRRVMAAIESNNKNGK